MLLSMNLLLNDNWFQIQDLTLYNRTFEKELFLDNIARNDLYKFMHICVQIHLYTEKHHKSYWISVF